MPVLDVTVLAIEGVKGKDLLSETDPYVTLKYDKQSFKTSVKTDAGANAEFHETFSFNVLVTPYLLEVTVLDKDLLSSSVMGATKVDFKTAVESSRSLDSYELQDKKGKPNGRIHLAMRYFA